MNNPLHQHHWVSVATHYTSPPQNPKFMAVDSKGDSHLLERSQEELYGLTRIYQKCAGCGIVQESVVLGHYKERDVEETTN